MPARRSPPTISAGIVDCTLPDAHIALDALTQLRRIERLQQVDGTVAYVANRSLESGP
jgi:hypothetical protein